MSRAVVIFCIRERIFFLSFSCFRGIRSIIDASENSVSLAAGPMLAIGAREYLPSLSMTAKNENSFFPAMIGMKAESIRALSSPNSFFQERIFPLSLSLQGAVH